MIRNLVFDIGLVLADFPYREAVASLTDDAAIQEKIIAATTEGKYWDELDRGIMTTQEVVDAMVSLSPENGELIRKFTYETIVDHMYPFDYSEGWLKGWHDAGYGVYILSNMSDHIYNANTDRFTFLRHVDGQIVSYRHKVMKPDPRIYNILCETYSLRPEECVFIDDRQKNIDAAAALGFATVRFVSYDDAQSKLKKLISGRSALS